MKRNDSYYNEIEKGNIFNEMTKTRATIIIIIIIIIIIPWLFSQLMSWAYQSLVRIEVKDHPASLEVILGQYLESLSYCWFSRPG